MKGEMIFSNKKCFMHTSWSPSNWSARIYLPSWELLTCQQGHELSKLALAMEGDLRKGELK